MFKPCNNNNNNNNNNAPLFYSANYMMAHYKYALLLLLMLLFVLWGVYSCGPMTGLSPPPPPPGVMSAAPIALGSFVPLMPAGAVPFQLSSMWGGSRQWLHLCRPVHCSCQSCTHLLCKQDTMFMSIFQLFLFLLFAKKWLHLDAHWQFVCFPGYRYSCCCC